MKLAKRLMRWQQTGSLWTPAQITTALWLDAADSATITVNGSKVTQWSDKSGNGRHVTQGTDSLRPTLGTNKIVFGGSNWLQNATAQLPLSEFVLAIVFRETTAVANAGVLSIKGSGNDYESTNGLIFGPSNKTSVRCICTGSSASSFDIRDTESPTGACPLSVYTIIKDAKEGRFFRNGNLLYTDFSFTAFTANSLGGFLLGARHLPSTPTAPYLNGEIMEIVYAPFADRQKLEGYLAHKWDGILGGSVLRDNLPSENPYKIDPPLVTPPVSWPVADAYTSLLLRFDGSFIDGSQNGLTATIGGDAAIDKIFPKFGTGCLTLDGAGDYIEYAASALFEISANDFTVEFWYRPRVLTDDSGNAYDVLFSGCEPSSEVFSYWATLYNNTATLRFLNGSNQDLITPVASGFVVGTWYHLAFVRDGSTYRLYKNGVQISTGTGTIGNTQRAFFIGSLNRTSHPSNGRFADFRFSKGICRYPGGTTFTPAQL